MAVSESNGGTRQRLGVLLLATCFSAVLAGGGCAITETRHVVGEKLLRSEVVKTKRPPEIRIDANPEADVLRIRISTTSVCLSTLGETFSEEVRLERKLDYPELVGSGYLVGGVFAIAGGSLMANHKYGQAAVDLGLAASMLVPSIIGSIRAIDRTEHDCLDKRKNICDFGGIGDLRGSCAGTRNVIYAVHADTRLS